MAQKQPNPRRLQLKGLFQDKRSDRVHAKTLTTVNHLLTKDEVQGVMARLITDQPDIEEIVCVYVTPNGMMIAPSVGAPETVLLLERAKACIVNTINALDCGAEDEPQGV